MNSIMIQSWPDFFFVTTGSKINTRLEIFILLLPLQKKIQIVILVSGTETTTILWPRFCWWGGGDWGAGTRRSDCLPLSPTLCLSLSLSPLRTHPPSPNSIPVNFFCGWFNQASRQLGIFIRGQAFKARVKRPVWAFLQKGPRCVGPDERLFWSPKIYLISSWITTPCCRLILFSWPYPILELQLIDLWSENNWSFSWFSVHIQLPSFSLCLSLQLFISLCVYYGFCCFSIFGTISFGCFSAQIRLFF